MEKELQIGRLYLRLNAIMTSDPEQLNGCVNRLSFQPGEVIAGYGDTLDHLYYLAKGKVRAFNLNAAGEEKTFSYINAGYFLCEAVFFAKGSNTGTLVAESACEIWSFSENYVYQQLFTQHPEIALHIIRSLSVKMMGIYSHVNELTIRQPEKAIAQLLLPWIEEQGALQDNGEYVLDIAITHQQIADLLGLHRVTVTKTLNTLQRKGIMKKEAKRWHIYDVSYLQTVLDD